MTDFNYIESRLGFYEIRCKLRDFCYTPVGKDFANDDFFSKDIKKIMQELGLTAEMKYINEFMGGVPALAFEDFRTELQQLKTQGSIAEIQVLRSIAFIIEKLVELKSLFSKNIEKTPLLHELISRINFDYSLAVRIGEIVDENGDIRSTASENLYKIRQEIVSQRKKIEKNIQHLFKTYKEKGIVDDEVNLSIRGGRLVIPVNASKKRLIKGVVLDESSTGQTAFVEPIEIFELNNEIQNLEFEEKREIIKILKSIADRIRPQIPELLSNIDFIGRIDFINAKSKLAIIQNAVMPFVSEDNKMTIMQGRHPVLEESLKKSERNIIPLDLELYPEQRMIIISGPNAGGKSVAMKTTGLLQYMFQCGFLIPAAEGTTLFPFDDILADIGDQQSIENDLSTYSSHLLNMKHFMQYGNEKTLVLIDEFGSGTEPESGGAIAEAVLEVLNANKCFGIITTHYFNLKTFASNHAGVVNGAMLFDNENLKPLYKLKIGKPGSSFALEIASFIGLPDIVISNASKRIGKGRIELEKMFQDIENEKQKLVNRKLELEVAENFVKELIEKYNKLNKSIIEKRDRIISKAENEAKNILADANKLIEKTIRNIRQEQAEKSKVKEIRNSFEKEADEILKPKKKSIESLPLKKVPADKEVSKKQIEVGDLVKLDNGLQTGLVVEIKNEKIKVQFDTLFMIVDASRLLTVPNPKQKENRIKQKVNIISERKETIYNIDFRGMNVAEAISELDKFIDNALMTGIKSFSILHGKGYGILRKEIRKHLRQYSDMLEFSDAPLQFGGEGVTEVRFL